MIAIQTEHEVLMEDHYLDRSTPGEIEWMNYGKKESKV